MASEMLTFLVESSQEKRTHGRQVTSFVTSFVAQAFVLAALVIVPLMATQALPTPQGIVWFMPVVPSPPAPPPPPPSRRAHRRAIPPRPVLSSTQKFFAPAEIPNGIDLGDFGAPTGVPGGIPEGILGSIIGSLPETRAVQEPVRVGGDIRRPQKTKDVRPIYPDLARQARVQGTVILEAIIDSLGNVTDVRVLRSVPLLDQAAIDAVRKWKYEPTRLNGVPVPIVMTVTVTFLLRS